MQKKKKKKVFGTTILIAYFFKSEKTQLSVWYEYPFLRKCVFMHCQHHMSLTVFKVIMQNYYLKTKKTLEVFSKHILTLALVVLKYIFSTTNSKKWAIMVELNLKILSPHLQCIDIYSCAI